MLRFSANLSTLFTEIPLRSRFSAAAMTGFEAVEIQFPYDLSPGEVTAELEVNRLQVVLINAPAGDMQAGERGLAALPGREAEFERALSGALDYALGIGCELVHVMAGNPSPSVDPERAMNVYIDNLRRAADEARTCGVTLVIEPINRRDMPGYLIDRTAAARRVIETVAQDSLGLLFDVYHRQITEGDVTRGLLENLDIIRHIQIANVPERCQPGRGEINFEHLFETLREVNYEGWIGCEYTPCGTTRDSFAWFDMYRPLRRRRSGFERIDG